MTRNLLIAALAVLAFVYFAADSPLSADKPESCTLTPVSTPNYNPLDGQADTPLPEPGELLPSREECPDLYEGSDDRGTAPPVPGFDPGGAPSLPEPKLPGPTPYPPQQPNPDPYGPYS